MGGAALAGGSEILCGLLMQVGAMYRDHGLDRDSSREILIGPRDSYDRSRLTANRPDYT